MTVAANDSKPVQVFAERRRTLVIGVLGCGTVGGGVVARLLATKVAGHEPARLGRVLVRDIHKAREPLAVAEHLTLDAADVVDDPEVDIVVETIGGIDIARELVERALRNGKHVVSANKALIATHGLALSKLAREHHVALRYEAAVGGAVPIVRAVTEAMAAEYVIEIAGVMNGTSNFIVGEMAAGGSFDDVLQRAQDAGYAEPDPTNDVDGHDAAQKLTVLATLGFRTSLEVARIWRGSLRRLTQADFALAEALDLKLVPLALAQRTSKGIRAMVAPSFVPRDHDFARAKGPGNVIRVHGQDSGPLQFSGTGAGRVPTASAVFSDLAEISHKMARWEYLGSDVLADGCVVAAGVCLPCIIRVPESACDEVAQELQRAGVATQKAAPNALFTKNFAVDELAAHIDRLSLAISGVALFPCFETELETRLI